jgi:hypothetical protein
MVRTRRVDVFLKRSGGQNASTDTARTDWPVLVAVAGCLRKSTMPRPKAAPFSGPARSPMMRDSA